MAGERLNRYISRAAAVSRRTADELIRHGRVTVGRRPVLEPGQMVDPGTDEIRLDGNTLVPAGDEKIYIMAYKPDNVVSTMKDKEGRATVASLVGELSSRVFPVGRLDYHTTGLILLTNDGDLAFRLTHPRFGVEKTYIAKVQGAPPPASIKILRKGLPIDGVMTNPAHVTFLEKREGKSWILVRIAEGRHHQVRKMFDAIGHRVMKLRRTAIGNLELSGVEPGEWRYLTGKEVRELMNYVEQKEQEGSAPRPPSAVRKADTRTERPSGPRSIPPDADRRGPRQPKPEWKKPSKGPPGKGAFPAKPGWPKSRPGGAPASRPPAPRPPKPGRPSSRRRAF